MMKPPLRGDGGCSSVVEHLVVVQEAAGSSPVTHPKLLPVQRYCTRCRRPICGKIGPRDVWPRECAANLQTPVLAALTATAPVAVSATPIAEAYHLALRGHRANHTFRRRGASSTSARMVIRRRPSPTGARIPRTPGPALRGCSRRFGAPVRGRPRASCVRRSGTHYA